MSTLVPWLPMTYRCQGTCGGLWHRDGLLEKRDHSRLLFSCPRCGGEIKEMFDVGGWEFELIKPSDLPSANDRVQRKGMFAFFCNLFVQVKTKYLMWRIQRDLDRLWENLRREIDLRHRLDRARHVEPKGPYR